MRVPPHDSVPSPFLPARDDISQARLLELCVITNMLPPNPPSAAVVQLCARYLDTTAAQLATRLIDDHARLIQERWRRLLGRWRVQRLAQAPAAARCAASTSP